MGIMAIKLPIKKPWTPLHTNKHIIFGICITPSTIMAAILIANIRFLNIFMIII